MPIYEYRCRGCGKDFEKYLPSAAAAVACPGCDSADVSRKLSVFGMRTDGSLTPSGATSPMMSGGGGCCGGGGCGCH
jgi:putative FmdB family regulatory protein